ncbi:chemotaxis protein [Brevibacillus laterosporus]|uniref:motility protein A n=1 Tax=Brevibacillus laterosporus TaxID=1465 RepID=UPI000BC659C2|nr:MotA/TolQ/ExbB proton channel family protein [Brevibacillus laterosporus]MCR8997592.1 MotA/TolQ/ExbB proton channel family protein [Brevibacillus laterosporus]PCN45468.1 chemotaxis protein [Brevibacillus laterosporus]
MNVKTFFAGRNRSLLLVLFIVLVLIHTIYLNGSVSQLLHPAAIELVGLSVIISYAIKRKHIKIKHLFRLLIHGRENNIEETIKRFYQYSVVLKEKGYISLEKELMDEPDSFVQRGALLAIEGVSEQELRMILENECKGEQHRYQQMGGMFRLVALLAPGMGLVGTLLGMTGVLQTLSDFTQTGQSLSTAVVATLYGALLANLLALPCYYRLMDIHDQEMFEKRLYMEGCVGLQRMETPRILFEKLNSFLPADQKLVLLKMPGSMKGIIERQSEYAG